MSKETIEAIVSAYFENLSAMNPQAWVETFADDAVVTDPVGKPPFKVRESFEKFFGIISQFYETLDVSPDRIFIAGNGAAVKWTMRVVAKNGKIATAEGIGVFEINESGKIQTMSSYWDEPAMLAQLKGE